ncbi:hypothetical protein L1887_29405 [Cichorium endivia]|nr:hypothetical protein L1887_29405 [Cichorium endivia]
MVVDDDSLLFDPSVVGEDEKSPKGGGDQRRRSVEWYIHDPPSLANLHTPLKTSFDSSRVADRSRFQLFAYLNSFFFDQFHYIYIQFVFNLDRSRLLCLLP